MLLPKVIRSMKQDYLKNNEMVIYEKDQKKIISNREVILDECSTKIYCCFVEGTKHIYPLPFLKKKFPHKMAWFYITC